MAVNLNEKRKKELEDDICENSDGSSGDEDMSDSEDVITESEEEIDSKDIEQIDAEFEAYNPSVEDEEGIKALLKQLFKKEPVELGMLTDYVIKESNFSTVIKQYYDENSEEDVEEDDDVFSLTSFIPFDETIQKKTFSKLISKFLIRTAKEKENKKIENVLENLSESNVVLLINERFINLPAKLGVMSIQNLYEDFKNKNPNSNLFLIICKLLKEKEKENNEKHKNKKVKITDENNLIYINDEDEIFSNNALEKYDFQIIDDHTDLTVNQNWHSGKQYTPYRKIVLLDRKNFEKSIKELKEKYL